MWGGLPLAQFRVRPGGETAPTAEFLRRRMEVRWEKFAGEQGPQLAGSPWTEAGSAPSHARL